MYKRFEDIGEYYAAGLFENPDASVFERFSRGIRRFFEHRELPEYNGEVLYPCGLSATDMAVRYDYCYTIGVNSDKLRQKDKIACDALENIVSKFRSSVPEEHTVGGSLYTHSFANFAGVIREGLSSYENRIFKVKDQSIKKGLLDVVEGIRAYHHRCLLVLEQSGADQKLCDALKKVPFEPADNLYEALVCWNFMYYVDGCDNIGRLDADLIDFYDGEDMTDVFRCMFHNIDANDGWSGALGPVYNELTLQCLNASKGLRRPSLELRVTPDMPDEVWECAIDCIKMGGGSPSMYNEVLYQTSLGERFCNIPKEDLIRFCGGGCTETMLAGISNVGSLDAGINLALIFEKTMRNKLPKSRSYEEFYDGFIAVCRTEIKKVLKEISLSQKLRAQWRPQPVRTLLVDDCIAEEKDFNNGGARYSWSIVNIAGMINVIDSLIVIRKVVFEDKALGGSEFLSVMDDGERFVTYPGIERYGSDTTESNKTAKKLSDDICGCFDNEKPWLGECFLPASIQFVTYVDAGKSVGATPDGRRSGEPLCDSVRASQCFGHNPTSMLNSASSLSQSRMLGTAVYNIMIDKNYSADTIKGLVKGYFANGGMQLQFSCVNIEDLKDAVTHPDKYPELIVRVGGYSEYFRRLTEEMRREIVRRNSDFSG